MASVHDGLFVISADKLSITAEDIAKCQSVLNQMRFKAMEAQFLFVYCGDTIFKVADETIKDQIPTMKKAIRYGTGEYKMRSRGAKLFKIVIQKIKEFEAIEMKMEMKKLPSKTQELVDKWLEISAQENERVKQRKLAEIARMQKEFTRQKEALSYGVKVDEPAVILDDNDLKEDAQLIKIKQVLEKKAPAKTVLWTGSKKFPVKHVEIMRNEIVATKSTLKRTDGFSDLKKLVKPENVPFSDVKDVSNINKGLVSKMKASSKSKKAASKQDVGVQTLLQWQLPTTSIAKELADDSSDSAIGHYGTSSSDEESKDSFEFDI
ncbi:unnamed protein product [Caenorhabditis brenneri]